jgi:neopullulanase
MNKVFLFFVSVSLTLASCVAQKVTLQHVEPHNWWTDMKWSEVEILVHAPNIANYKFEVKGLNVLGVTKTENPNYLFIKVDTKGKPAGSYPILFSDTKKVVAEYNFELKNRRANSAQRTSFTSADLMYLLMPDRFANGDPSNDSHPSIIEKLNREFPGGRHGGDIQGIINNLDYIASIGATAIWTTPILEDNDSTYSYHTYGQSDLYKVDPRYGTNEDYKRLVQEAHKRNIKIIKDEVPNHWGYMHWMMKDLPTYQWIHQFPGYAQSNYRTSTQMDPNASERDKKYCSEGWFVRSMPDLNQSHPLVLNYLIQNTIWWVEYADIDGIRVDTYSYNDKQPIAEWTKAIMNEYPNFNMVGEIWMHDQAQVSYWQKDSPIAAIQSYNTHLPSVMDFTLHDAFGPAFKEEDQGWDRGVVRFYENFVNDFLYKDPNNLLVFLENHDTDRFNEIYKSLDAYKLGLTVIATVRGIPQIYYGSEIGMRGDKSQGDAAIRQDFPGGWKEDKQNAFTAAGRTSEQNTYFDFTQKLFNWRKTSKAIHHGTFKQFLPENNVYVYFRETAEEVVMVVINNQSKDQNLNLSRFAECIGNAQGGKEILSGQNVSFSSGSIAVKGKSSMIIEWKK